MHNYKELNVWKLAVDFATDVYKITAQFPAEERFGLQSQIRRSAVSIASNIAEGAGRNSKGEFKQFLGIAYGSAYELETQFFISRNLAFITEEEINQVVNKIETIQKMIYKLKSSLS
ncbi:four helix bundle protein [Nafulsella turpanensis]|uniref:four helix bundle protein n=1 Tax=Nafulsella turpanensis TaxID=1265690 RepID=UPI0003486592|nr:four helix bundle protein [Nafulsella turpanensis]